MWHVGYEVTVAPTLYSQIQAERVAPIWEMFFLQEKDNGSMMYGSETSAQIWDMSILLIFHLLKLVTWLTLIFEGEEYFSQREGVPCKHHIFSTINSVITQ